MPIVPLTVQPISTDVPSITGADTVVGGQTARAWEQAGQVVANSGIALLEDVKRSEAVDTSSKAYFDDKYAAQDKMSELKIQYPNGYVEEPDANGVKQKKQNADGTYRTITQEFRDWANERYTKTQQSLPTEMAQELYKSKSGPLFTDAMSMTRTEEMSLRTNSFKRGQETDLLSGTVKLVQTPLVKDAYDLGDILNERVQAQTGMIMDHGKQRIGLFTPKDAADQHDKIWKDTADSLMKGQIDQILFMDKGSQARTNQIQYAVNILDGVDPDSNRRKRAGLKTLSETMNPDDKAKYYAELAHLASQADEISASHWNRVIQASSSQLDLEAHNPKFSVRVPMKFGPIYREGAELLRKGVIDDLEFVQKLGGLVAQNKFNQMQNDSLFLTADPGTKKVQIQAAADGAFKEFMKYASGDVQKNYPQATSAIRNQIVNNLVDLSARRDEIAHKDFVEFAQARRDIHGRTQALDASFTTPTLFAQSAGMLVDRARKLQQLGDAYFGGKSNDFRVVSNDEANRMGSWIKDPKTSYAEVAGALNSIKSADPRVYATMVDEMIRDNKLPADYRLALKVGNTTLTRDIIRTIKDGDKIRDLAKDALAANGVKSEDFEKAVTAQMLPYLQGMTGSNPDSSISIQDRTLMSKTVATKAMEMYNYELGETSTGKHNVEDYAKRAVDAFMGTQYTVVQTKRPNAFGFGGTLKDSVLIPNVGEMPRSPKEQENLIYHQGLYTQPEQLKKFGALIPPNAGNIGYEEFAKQVAKGRLQLAPNGEGYYIRYPEFHTQSPVRVMIKNKQGRVVPLFIPKDSVLAPPPVKPAEPPKPQPKTMQDLIKQGGTIFR
jgi:hypothetical protein